MQIHDCDIKGYDFQAVLPYDIGFLIVCYKKHEADQGKIIDALYKKIMDHKGYDIKEF